MEQWTVTSNEKKTGFRFPEKRAKGKTKSSPMKKKPLMWSRATPKKKFISRENGLSTILNLPRKCDTVNKVK